MADIKNKERRIFFFEERIFMDGVSGVSADVVAQSVDALNQIMQAAQAQSIEMAQKMIAMQAEMLLSVEPGKGEILDIIA